MVIEDKTAKFVFFYSRFRATAPLCSKTTVLYRLFITGTNSGR